MAEWSEQWTLGASFGAQAGTEAVTGPTLYGDQTVEVVPKQEAEEKIEAARQAERERLREEIRQRLQQAAKELEEAAQMPDEHALVSVASSLVLAALEDSDD